MRVIVTLIVMCGIALAQPTTGEQHSARGQALYKQGKYRDAHAAFAAGFEASKLPAFMFDMAECSRLTGDIEVARGEYGKFLGLDPNGKLAPLARQRLAALPAAPPEPAPPPTTTPPAPTPVAAVPPPAVVAKQVEAARPTAPTPVLRAEESPPLWKRKSVWIAVGVAVAAGTVATIAATRHAECTGACLDWTHQ